MTYTEKRRLAASICRRVIKEEGRPRPPEGREPVSKDLLKTATEIIDSCFNNGELIDAIISTDKVDLKKYENQELLYHYCLVLNNRVKRIKAAMKEVLEREGE